MPAPALVIWILGIPFAVAIVDLIRTTLALKRMPASHTGRGAWSHSLRVRS